MVRSIEVRKSPYKKSIVITSVRQRERERATEKTYPPPLRVTIEQLIQAKYTLLVQISLLTVEGFDSKIRFMLFINAQELTQLPTLICFNSIWNQGFNKLEVLGEICYHTKICHRRAPLPSDPPMCFPFTNTWGTVRLPMSAIKASWMSLPSSVRYRSKFYEYY